VASLQTRRASTRSATRLRGLQRIRADSPAATGCSWANPIRKPAPPAGRIVTTGSSPRPSPAGLVGTIALEESIVAQLERFGPSRLLNFGESTRSPRPRSSSVRGLRNVANSIVRSAISHQAKQPSAAPPTGGCLWANAATGPALLLKVLEECRRPVGSVGARAPRLSQASGPCRV
jgi:hypothetical protein